MTQLFIENIKFEFKVEYVDVDVRSIKSIVKGPKSSPSVGVQKVKQGLLKCHFIPGESGKFEVGV
jgi:hypothetical protein